MPLVRNTEIRKRRRRLGLKLGPFAEQAQVAYKHLANIESGTSQPGIEVVHRIAAALGCDASDILAAVETDQAA
jgi:transcriptional regulator with XRE-family HTH domain